MVCASKPSQSKYRLSKTLRRKSGFREFKEEDIKYFWLLYKRGKTKIPSGLEANDFKGVLQATLPELYDYGWTLEGHTSKGYLPVGFLFGQDLDTMIFVCDVTWLPWASSRNKIETVTRFFSDMRRQKVVIGMSTMQDKKFYEHIARHGVIRRVGTLYRDEPWAMFQTRMPNG